MRPRACRENTWANRDNWLKRARVLCAVAGLAGCADGAVEPAREPEPPPPAATGTVRGQVRVTTGQDHGYGPDMFAFVAGADTPCEPRSCESLAVAIGADTAYTDGTGRFVFEQVPVGEHRLHVVEGDHPRRTAFEAPSTYWHAAVFDTAQVNVSGPGASVDVVLEARTVPVVVQQFFRAVGGNVAERPLPGLAVALYAPDGAAELDRGTTDAHGEVVFRPLSFPNVGDYRIRGDAWVLGSDPGNARYACNGDTTRAGAYSWGTLSCEDWREGVRLPALLALYEATDGANWRNADGWLTDAPQSAWHGVSIDATTGGLTGLDLSANGLTGRLPPGLASLDRLTALLIGGNAGLAGRLPLSLTRLELRELNYAGTDLCVPATAAFRSWLAAIPSHTGTGVDCDAASTQRDILWVLFEATDGRNWRNSDGWLTDAPLGEWHGIGVDSAGAVTELTLPANGLSGPIPAELADLTSVEYLDLFGNELTGPIPPGFGRLARLWLALDLADNALTGPIPAELGNLAALEYLDLSANELTGPIPAELGKLTSVEHLDLSNNELTGPVPAALGDLDRLAILNLSDNSLAGSIPPEVAGFGSLADSVPPVSLDLSGNDLSGSIPPGLGNHGRLAHLYLADNELSGTVPGELGGMTGLRSLVLVDNRELSGALPADLTRLARLEALHTAGTGLCAPSDPDFLAWLEGVHSRRVHPCDAVAPPTVYLTQTVQSRDWPVPLVAGEEALLRVFATAARAGGTMPAARARFYLGGREVHVEDIPATGAPLPVEVDEGDFAASLNARVRSDIVRPGLELVIEVDPDGTLDRSLGVARRIPEDGRLAVEVRSMPSFDLTLIPFLNKDAPDSSIVELVAAMAADPTGHELLRETRTLLPIADLAVRAHEPVLTDSRSAYAMFEATGAIRAMEGGTRHYMGMMPEPDGPAGLARQPGRVSFAAPRGTVVAHELGHNLNLGHTPCGDPAWQDPAYPYADGSIGAWGWDAREGGGLVPPGTPDLMGYCDSQWISDYQFTNALRFRLREARPEAVVAARALLVWGGVGADGLPYLRPAFAIEAPPALPVSVGEYRLTGLTVSGTELFSVAFAMPALADGGGRASFAYALPVAPEWEALAVLTLSGPGGSATLDAASDRPMVILLNPRNGQVRGILRDPPLPTQVAGETASAAAGPSLEVLFSRGVPDAAAWRRR
ncbi:MAG: M66 family metalloprotease [Gammaproteobacteria bacterium]|nr:M66 family metalloprotease [Gammaproteobacteria bacterium]